MTKYLIQYSYTLAGKTTTMLVKNQNGSVRLYENFGDAEDDAKAVVRGLTALDATFEVLAAA